MPRTPRYLARRVFRTGGAEPVPATRPQVAHRNLPFDPQRVTEYTWCDENSRYRRLTNRVHGSFRAHIASLN